MANLIRSLQILYTSLSVCGIGLMLYIAYDNWYDLQILLRRRVNGYARLTASIGIWDAIAAACFHCLFLILGILALRTPLPIGWERQRTAILFTIGFIVMQMLILGVQSRNQAARIWIRRRMQREPQLEDPKWHTRCRECLVGEPDKADKEEK